MSKFTKEQKEDIEVGAWLCFVSGVAPEFQKAFADMEQDNFMKQQKSLIETQGDNYYESRKHYIGL